MKMLSRIKEIIKNPYFSSWEKFLAVLTGKQLWNGEVLFDENINPIILNKPIKIFGQKKIEKFTNQ